MFINLQNHILSVVAVLTASRLDLTAKSKIYDKHHQKQIMFFLEQVKFIIKHIPPPFKSNECNDNIAFCMKLTLNSHFAFSSCVPPFCFFFCDNGIETLIIACNQLTFQCFIKINGPMVTICYKNFLSHVRKISPSIQLCFLFCFIFYIYHYITIYQPFGYKRNLQEHLLLFNKI